eukprot:m.61991 g.61991  ORF g.61991 m.61991 type:complete len:357 (-) comp9589_c0_seq2:81-1151(-)
MSTMKAIVAAKFGEPAAVLSMTEIPRPTIEAGKKQLLLRVQACSITPGDWRTLSGDTSAIRTPKKWPYVPAQDVAGVIVDMDEEITGYSVGDEVVATWGGLMPEGGMAEYCLVDAALSAIRPKELTPIQAAALVNSAAHALIGVEEANIQKTDRVLVLGGTGGAGTALVQLLKNLKGVAFVAATSTDTGMLGRLGVDRPIDYREENWWELQEFRDTPFDVVFDLAEGATGWKRCQSSGVVKTASENGRYYTFLLDEWHIDAKSMLFIATFASQLLYRKVTSVALALLNMAPTHQMKLSTPDMHFITQIMELGASGDVVAPLVEDSSYPFTAEGAIAAFDMLRSRHAKGKIVMKVSD